MRALFGQHNNPGVQNYNDSAKRVNVINLVFVPCFIVSRHLLYQYFFPLDARYGVRGGVARIILRPVSSDESAFYQKIVFSEATASHHNPGNA